MIGYGTQRHTNAFMHITHTHPKKKTPTTILKLMGQSSVLFISSLFLGGLFAEKTALWKGKRWILARRTSVGLQTPKSTHVEYR